MNLQDNGLKSNPSSSAPAPATPPTVTETVRTSIFLPPMLQSYDQGPPLPPALCARQRRPRSGRRSAGAGFLPW